MALESSEKDFALQRLAQVKLLQARFLVRDKRPAEAAFKEARKAMEDALKENQNNAFVLRDAAELAFRESKTQKKPDVNLVRSGLQAADRALQINSRSAEALALRGSLYRLLANVDNPAENERLAKDSLAQAFKLNPYLVHEYD